MSVGKPRDVLKALRQKVEPGSRRKERVRATFDRHPRLRERRAATLFKPDILVYAQLQP